ncbi:hypothetical protein [Leifsonia shinshuensis]|uniref:YncE family protein n=1 Tax=Leifsonia shinshuensis TaxID=150026 RepID=UPI0028630C25|nr:hypothetical protein [Leifsonia shinshuensis]MDR6972352.1 hypothetical protein [Leifsonia shinshuensis]
MKKLFALPLTVLATAALIFAATGPAAAGARYSVTTISLANTHSRPQAIAADPLTGTLYVGQQDGAAGAMIAVLGPSGGLRTYIRVGESFDAASNVPPDGERPAPHAPSRVIALTVNSLTRTVIALVTDTWINTNPTYSGLSGSYVVTVNMRTNTVSHRYTVAAPASEPEAAAEGWHDISTMWTGFALDPVRNVLWGIEGYDPRSSNAIDRLDLTTGVHGRAALPVVANDSPIDAVPTIAFNIANGHAYVSVAGVIFVVDGSLRIINRLQVPGLPGCDVLPGSGQTAIVASPWTSTLYMTWCGGIYVINGATNVVTRPFPTIPLGKAGLAYDPLGRSLYVYETRNGVKGLGIYSTVTATSRGFVPLALSDEVPTAGNAWIANSPLLKTTYVTSSASTISAIATR